MKIILVDDDPLALEGISRILHWERFDGCLAGCAADGREAVALLEREPISGCPTWTGWNSRATSMSAARARA